MNYTLPGQPSPYMIPGSPLVSAASLNFPQGIGPNNVAPPVVAPPVITPAQAASAVMPTSQVPGMSNQNAPGATAPAANAATDATAQGGGFFSKLGGADGLASLMESLASLGSIYTGMQSIKLAKQEHQLSKEAYRTNLKNTRMSYNTAVEDRTRSRYATEGRSDAEAQDYIKKHSV